MRKALRPGNQERSQTRSGNRTRRAKEVIRVTQWAEIRHMHLVDGVPKKEIARRFELNVKTVRTAIAREAAPERRESPPRGRRLDAFRGRIEQWLRDEPRITAKRIGRLLQAELEGLCSRSVREYVAELRREVHPPECFVHRTHKPGKTMEADFGESWAIVAGELRRIKYLVVTLPASRLHFAKAYPLERTECLLDGLLSAFEWFGGVPERVVLDNTSLAVKKVLKGPDRIETQMFEAFRGAFPFHPDFCAPAKGNEKGSVEGGVKYIRGNAFVPRPEVESFDDLNALILSEIERDLDCRKVSDGRTVREAWAAERALLRPLPAHRVETCRVLTAMADKYAHVRVDRSTYSIPAIHTRMPVTVKLYHDRVEISARGEVVARHARALKPRTMVLDAWHILRVLERKHRAIAESTAIGKWKLPEVFSELRTALSGATRKGDQEWASVLLLTEAFPQSEVEEATRKALEQHSPRLATIEMILRQSQKHRVTLDPLKLSDPKWSSIRVAEPQLTAWDTLYKVQA